MRQMPKLFPMIPLLTLMLLLPGCDGMPVLGGGDSGLSASGVVEAVEVRMAPELGGRVAEIYVAEGDAVQEGDPLFRLDDELLQSERRQAVTRLELAQSELQAAQTGLEMARATLRAAETGVNVANANAQVELQAAQQALDELYQSAGVAKTQAQQVVAAANRAVRESQYMLDNFTVSTEQQNYTAMEAIEVMEGRLDQARQVFEPYKYKDSGNPTRKDLKEKLDEAQSDYDAAVRRLEYETALDQARATLEKAMLDLEKLQDGPDPDAVALLQARIAAAEAAPEQAEAAVEQVETGVDEAQTRLEQAEKTVVHTQATLEQIDIQMEKLTVQAAASGVVLIRNIEPGEVLQPGVAAVIIGQLDDLTVTVYIPEDRYGMISLGDHAKVNTDSFPGEFFDAVVTRIADRAEYTPRNVQTKDDRATTVFAIKLTVDDQQGKLKPGMPVDVDFDF